MSVAIVQGCSKGFGCALAQNLLATTKLNVVGTTASGAKHAYENILSGTSMSSGMCICGVVGAINEQGNVGETGVETRLTTLDMDIRDEDAVQRVSEEIQSKFGKKPLRMLVNVSGMLHAEKNIKQISQIEALRSFEINTIGHMLAFKHFVPLVARAPKQDEEDFAQGALPEGKSLLASISARVGSIEDNQLGGWYSYRASKAALNQVIKTLSLELKAHNVPAVALAYHPGTVRTRLSKDFVGPGFKAPARKDGEYGVFEPDEAVVKLMSVIKGMDVGASGSFLDWTGSRVPW